MLIHLTPRYYSKYSDVQVDVIDVEIPEFKLLLKANIDVVIRTPFRNKNYKVVCRKKGRKAVNGIIIEINDIVQNFTVITRWAVNGEISRHETYYHVNDNEFDSVTEENFLWNGFYNTPYRNRCKEIKERDVLIKRQSTMVTLVGDINSNDNDSDWTFNTVDKQGIVRFRAEYITLPTVERERLTSSFFGNVRLPPYEDAFNAQVYPYGFTVVPGTFEQLGTYIVPLNEWINDIKDERDGGLFFQVLDEIKEKIPFFLSNSNHLKNLAKSFSQTYKELDGDNIEYINGCLNQPIFHVFIEEVDESGNKES